MRIRTEAGNILFLILLAIIVFAALAYAITNSMRGGGKNASSDKADLVASQLLQNAHLFEETILRAQMVQNIPDWGFDVYPLQAHNNTCTQTECKIYTNNGGSVPFYKIPAEFTTNGVDDTPGTTDRDPSSMTVAKMVGIGTDANDLILVYDKFNITLCNAINRLAAKGIDSSIVDGIGGTNASYTGTLTAMPASTGIVGDTNPTLVGAKFGCTFIGTAAQYRFYYTVMER